MSLRAWQQALQSHILDGDRSIVGLLLEGPAPVLGLDIYADAYRARLLQALTDMYPALQLLAGDEVLLQFIEIHPPRVANLRWYGDAMAVWLRSQRPRCPEVWIAMAELEWTLAMVFEATDAALATRQTLATFAAAEWPQLVLRPVPAWRCLPLPANLVELRRSLLAATCAAGPVAVGATQDWVLWRQGYTVQQRALGAEEAELVQGLQAGESLAMLCERLARIHPPQQVAGRVLGWIELWLQQAWIGLIEPPAAVDLPDLVFQHPHDGTAEDGAAP